MRALIFARRLAPAWASAAVVAALALESAAQAAPCGRPDLVEAFPDVDAAHVPTDAILSAVYAASADYLGEEVTLAREGEDERPVPARFDANERTLSVTPAEALQPETRYTVRWPALRGRNASAPGLGRTVTFTTGPGPDIGPPLFEGASGLTWDLEREVNDCTDDIEERFRFKLTFTPADDDGGRESLALLVFQTAGPTIGAAPEPVLVAHLPEAGKPVHVLRTTADATGRVCFAAMVRDLRGQISGGADREVCTTTPPPPFFQGCAVASSASASGRVGLGVLALAVLLGFAVARRRGRAVLCVWVVASMSALGPARAAADEPNVARLALVADGARGFARAGFYNQMVGARLDVRFSRELTLGGYLGYVNLKGPDGRAHNVLPLVQVEYRAMLGHAASVPLRLGSGLLPRNGPLLRAATGLAFPMGQASELVLLAGATAWITNNEQLTSLDMGLEVSFPL